MLECPTSETPPIRVLVADNNLVFLEAVTHLIDDEHTLSVVGRATEGRETIQLAATLQPDVVVLDLNMPGMHGLRAIPEIRQVAPFARIIVLTFYDEQENQALATAAGAAAFIAKSETDAKLIPTIVRFGRANESPLP